MFSLCKIMFVFAPILFKILVRPPAADGEALYRGEAGFAAIPFYSGQVVCMALQQMVIICGALAIAVFILHGLFMGRTHRTPLVRDEMAENNARSTFPTSNEAGVTQGSVKIIGGGKESAAMSSAPGKEFIDNTEDIVLKNSEAEEHMTAEARERQPEEEPAAEAPRGEESEGGGFFAGLAAAVKSFFGRLTAGREETAGQDAAAEPLSVYQINVRKKDGSPISVDAAVQICESCGLTLGEHDIYYYYDKKNPNNEVFRVCGSHDPYGFAKSYRDAVSYGALCLFMPLPDRGFAEDSYLEMAAFAYRFAYAIGGEMIDNNQKVIGEEFIMRHRAVLAGYDKLS